ncbi:MAG TPA: hypothetical protein DF699_02525, partial [Phycisphaerales bacterium]|nr:hypothetical protein [Phycisphaerales bacterium]
MSEQTNIESERVDESPELSEADIHRLELQRRENRDAVRMLGFNPYGQRSDALMTLAQAHAAFDEGADLENKESTQARKQAKRDTPDTPESELPAIVDQRPIVRVAGRVVLSRDNGKLIWLNLRDHTNDSFQIAVSKRDCDENGFK